MGGRIKAPASDQAGFCVQIAMATRHIEYAIRYIKRITDSIEDQVDIAHALYQQGIDQTHNGVKADDLEAELGLSLTYEVRTSLKHLVDLGLVNEFQPPGPDYFVIAEWKDSGNGEIVNGEVEEAAEEGIEGLIEDLDPFEPSGGDTATATDGGASLRSALAEEFDLIPEAVEDYLQSASDPVDVLNRAVSAVEEAEGIETSEDYGEIGFARMPYQYRLTPAAVQLYER